MITEFLVGHRWLCPAILVVLLVLGPVTGRWLTGRPALAWGLAGLSLLPVVRLTLTPVGVLVHRGCTMQWALPTIGRVEIFANVVLFVAPVYLAALALRRPLVAFAGGSALSAAVEVAQVFLPGRACDTNDWLNNTIGALIGAGLAWIALQRRSRLVTERHGSHESSNTRR